MSTFGDIERLFADLYPYRWAIGAGVLVLIAAVAAYGFWKGWHLAIWRHRLPVAIVATPVLAITIWLGWSLGSPLFTNVTIEEEFPFAAHTFSLPQGVDMAQADEIMAGIAKFNQEAVEDVSATAALAKSNGLNGGAIVMNQPEAAVLQDGMAMVSEAMEKSDQIMMDKGIEMMKEAIDSSVEAANQQPQVVLVRAGDFMDADAFHRGSGRAVIYRGPDGSHLLRLEDLDVTNGPDLRVILTPTAEPEAAQAVTVPGFVELGKLKGNRGNQNYPIPDEVDINDHGSVVIYCKPFGVVFSVATLGDAA